MVKQVIVHNIARLVKIILDYKSHVAEGEIYEVTHQNEVVHLVIDSVPVAEFELRFFEFFDINFVALELAGLFTVDDVVLLCQVLVAPPVLEEHGFFLDVKRFNLDVLGKVPDDDAVHRFGLRNTNCNSCLVTSCTNLDDEGVKHSFIDVQAYSCQFLTAKAELPDFTCVPIKNVVLIHGNTR